jgi:hypothetical protein
VTNPLSHCDSAEKPSVNPSRARPELDEGTNGRAIEIIGNFSDHGEPVEPFLWFFSRIALQDPRSSAASGSCSRESGSDDMFCHLDGISSF